MHVMAPQYLRKLVPSTVSERNRYNVRSRHNLSNIRTRTNLFNNSFFPSVIRLWNELPRTTRNAEAVEEFENKLNRNSNIDKPNKLYYIGDRRLAISHARLRMQCACNTANEDAFHYLCECPRYRLYREELQMTVITLAPFTYNSYPTIWL